MLDGEDGEDRESGIVRWSNGGRAKSFVSIQLFLQCDWSFVYEVETDVFMSICVERSGSDTISRSGCGVDVFLWMLIVKCGGGFIYRG